MRGGTGQTSESVRRPSRLNLSGQAVMERRCPIRLLQGRGGGPERRREQGLPPDDVGRQNCRQTVACCCAQNEVPSPLARAGQSPRNGSSSPGPCAASHAQPPPDDSPTPLGESGPPRASPPPRWSSPRARWCSIVSCTSWAAARGQVGPTMQPRTDQASIAGGIDSIIF